MPQVFKALRDGPFMRRGLSLALWAATVVLQTLALEAQGRVLVERGDEWRFLKGNVEPPTDWAAPLFDDSSWFHGPTGLGYGDNDDATVLDDMQCNYIALFAHRAFSVKVLAPVHTLGLSIDYDDAFASNSS